MRESEGTNYSAKMKNEDTNLTGRSLANCSEQRKHKT